MRRTPEMDVVTNEFSRRFMSVFWTGFVGVAGLTALACTVFVLWGAAWLIGLV